MKLLGLKSICILGQTYIYQALMYYIARSLRYKYSTQEKCRCNLWVVFGGHGYSVVLCNSLRLN